MRFAEHLWIMENAFRQAELAALEGEVPVGAIITDQEGREIAKAYNKKEANHDACAHAEILVMKKVAKNISNWRLNQFNLYVTLEPCIMCMSAISQFRIKNLIFGAYDPKGGALSLNYNIHKDERLNHKIKVLGGVSQYKCSKILSDFFKLKRD